MAEFEVGDWTRPAHYGGEENPFEPIKIIEYYGLNFSEGNALKYLLRNPAEKIKEHEGWGDDQVQAQALAQRISDLKKTYTYIGFELRRLERAYNPRN